LARSTSMTQSNESRGNKRKKGVVRGWPENAPCGCMGLMVIELLRRTRNRPDFLTLLNLVHSFVRMRVRQAVARFCVFTKIKPKSICGNYFRLKFRQPIGAFWGCCRFFS
jgi:hypothetical protein